MPKGVHGRRKQCESSKEIPYKDDSGEQEYARVTKILGNGRVLVKCEDNAEWQARVRGSMRRRQWVHVGDVVLACKRPFESDGKMTKADIVHVYSADAVSKMMRVGELQKVSVEEVHEDGQEDYIDFEVGSDIDDI
jgi:translation initiation factor 1A